MFLFVWFISYVVLNKYNRLYNVILQPYSILWKPDRQYVREIAVNRLKLIENVC